MIPKGTGISTKCWARLHLYGITPLHYRDGITSFMEDMSLFQGCSTISPNG